MIGSDPDGWLGEAPRPELREQGRISGACFDAARGIIPGLKVYKLVLIVILSSLLSFLFIPEFLSMLSSKRFSTLRIAFRNQNDK